MSIGIRILTALLLGIPAAMTLAPLAGHHVLLGPLVLVCAIYAWIWLRFRPSRFIVEPGAIQIIWPLKRSIIPRSSIVAARLMSRGELAREVGWSARVGAGGLWGAFGWLWTRRRGIVQMYISRTDDLVWLERGSERPWLITPEEPVAFVRELGVGGKSVGQPAVAPDAAASPVRY